MFRFLLFRRSTQAILNNDLRLREQELLKHLKKEREIYQGNLGEHGLRFHPLTGRFEKYVGNTWQPATTFSNRLKNVDEDFNYAVCAGRTEQEICSSHINYHNYLCVGVLAAVLSVDKTMVHLLVMFECGITQVVKDVNLQNISTNPLLNFSL